jgi:MoaA/NifB/PqqE/SkfB family radical SAM enzyme
MNSIYCYDSELALSISPKGFLTPCCASSLRKEVVNELADLSDFYNGSEMKNIRETLARGEWPNSCLACKSRERKGVLSRRQKSNKTNLKKIDSYSLETIASLEKIDIAFSNKCNMDCVFCSPEFSSMWKKHVKSVQDLDVGLRFGKTDSSTSMDFSKEDWISFLVEASGLKKIDVKGGEPTIEESFINLLEAVVELSRFDIHINVNTNGIGKNDKFIKYVKLIPNLNYCFSIDGIGKTYEFIRGQKFSLIEENFKKYLAHCSEKVTVNFTSCNLNILGLEDFVGWLSSLELFVGKRLAYLDLRQIVDHPDFLSPLVISEGEVLQAKNMLLRIAKKNYHFIKKNELYDLNNLIVNSSRDEYYKHKDSLEKYLSYFKQVRMT